MSGDRIVDNGDGDDDDHKATRMVLVTLSLFPPPRARMSSWHLEGSDPESDEGRWNVSGSWSFIVGNSHTKQRPKCLRIRLRAS